MPYKKRYSPRPTLASRLTILALGLIVIGMVIYLLYILGLF